MKKTAISPDEAKRTSAGLKTVTTGTLMRMLGREGEPTVLKDSVCNQSGSAIFRGLMYKLLERGGLDIPQVAQRAMISKAFIYQMLGGSRQPGRDMVLRLAVCLKASVEETQRLLRSVQRGALYPRIHRDALIIYGLNRKLGLDELNERLLSEGEEPLYVP